MSEDKKQKSNQNYGPGNVLRTRREENEWSIESVAEALHLSTYSIKAIEADRYEDLPGATYVIGYWRSYARLLGINIDDTIESNKRNLNVVVPESRGLDVSRSYHYGNNFGIKGWLFVLIFLSASGYYVWHQNFFGLRTNLQAVNEEQLPVITNIDDDQDSPDLVQPSQELQVLRPLEEVVDDALPSKQINQDSLDNQSSQSNDAATLSEASVLTNSAENSPEQPRTLKPADIFQNSEQQGMVVSANSSTSNSSNTTATMIEASQTGDNNVAESSSNQNENNNEGMEGSEAEILVLDESILVFKIIKDSWLDVRDKTNKRLLYKTELAGQVVKVKGNPPFYVYIGAPNDVTVQYKGKDVPFETHKSGLFARFKIGDTLENL